MAVPKAPAVPAAKPVKLSMPKMAKLTTLKGGMKGYIDASKL